MCFPPQNLSTMDLLSHLLTTLGMNRWNCFRGLHFFLFNIRCLLPALVPTLPKRLGMFFNVIIPNPLFLPISSIKWWEMKFVSFHSFCFIIFCFPFCVSPQLPLRLYSPRVFPPLRRWGVWRVVGELWPFSFAEFIFPDNWRSDHWYDFRCAINYMLLSSPVRLLP